MDFLKNLSLNRRLAATAFALGFLAIFAGSPYKGAGATVRTKEIALAMATGSDQVDIVTLADWIVQGKADFRLVDLRSSEAYAAYHIPPAERIDVAALGQAPMSHNEKIVLYAEDGARAAQAWMLLKAKGYRGVYILTGGLDAWKERILFPRIPANATPEQLAEFARAREVAKFFGGTPQATAADSTAGAVVAMPALAMPASPAVAGGGAPKKKKKEGC